MKNKFCHTAFFAFSAFLSLLCFQGCEKSSNGKSPPETQSGPPPGNTEPNLLPAFLIQPYALITGTNGITLVWETDTPTTGELKLWQKDTLLEARQEKEEGFFHKIFLSGLKPKSLLRYSVTIESVSSSGEAARKVMDNAERHFWTSPPADSSFTFFVYGDNRSRPEDHSKVCQALALAAKEVDQPCFLLHTGDFVSDGRKKESWLSEFFNPASQVLKLLSLAPCIGNHEYHSEWYYRYMRAVENNEGNQAWFSFDFGCAHFIILDSTVDLSMQPEEISWLRQDLLGAQEKGFAWVIVAFHTPAYASGLHGGSESVRKNLVPLLKEGKVALVFNGHDHLYERLFDGEITYVVTGGGGAPLYQVRQERDPYSQVAESSLHFCRVDVSPEVIEVRAYRTDHSLIDHFLLKKGNKAPEEVDQGR